jgi:DNA-binding LacI/PurR family transcriptional regulator
MPLGDAQDRCELQDEYLPEMPGKQARAIVLLGALEGRLLLAGFRVGPVPLIFVKQPDPGARDSPFVGIDNTAAAATWPGPASRAD